MGWLDKLVTVEGKVEAKAPTTPVKSGIQVAPQGAMSTSLDDVLASPGRNSADMIIKLREGLAMFPEPQQLAMLRAMDGADASWDEASVIADAQARLDALDKHLDRVQADARDQESRINALCADAIQDSQDKVSELDQQIAALQQARATAINQATMARANADSQISAVQDKAKTITEEAARSAAKYREIIKFFK